MRSLNDVISALPPDRRAKVDERAKRLVGEELALRRLREARNLTQSNMATVLETDQASISKMEKRSDMLVSTFRSYVEAMGGNLRMVAEFPDGCVEVSTLGAVAEEEKPAERKRPKKARMHLVPVD